jgi:hypothetical protein
MIMNNRKLGSVRFEEPLNSGVTEVYPSEPTDGKFLLIYEEKIVILTSPGNGAHAIYWADAQ